jgi:hypothetical protein
MRVTGRCLLQSNGFATEVPTVNSVQSVRPIVSPWGWCLCIRVAGRTGLEQRGRAAQRQLVKAFVN